MSGKHHPNKSSRKQHAKNSSRTRNTATRPPSRPTGSGRLTPPPTTMQVQYERPDTNQHESVVVVPTFDPSDPRASIPRSPEGFPGVYRINFVLTIPGKEDFRTELNVPKLMQSGESLLLVPQEAAQLKVTIKNDQDQAEVVFLPNASGSLATAQIRVTASNFLDAQNQAYGLVMPILSWWSFRYDIALDITGYVVEEEQTQVTKAVFGVIGKAKGLDLSIGGFSKPEYRRVFAAYREGANATNVFYQVLCFYKVIEGVKKLRDQRRQAILAAGKAYTEPPDEKIPPDENAIQVSDSLREFFQPYLGKKFTWVLDQLRGLLRNTVAHLDPTGDSLIADELADIHSCERALPVIRYISRVMLRNEIQADPDMTHPHIL